MKKLLSVFMVLLLLIPVFGIVPTVSAEEVTYTVIERDYAEIFWEQIGDKKTIINSGEWYYAYDGSMPSSVTNLSVCGYRGNETDIVIPTEFAGYKITSVQDFYFMSDTVKTVRIPKEITDIGQPYNPYEEEEDDNAVYGAVFEGESPIQDIIVDSENSGYSSLDGVLFSKNFVNLKYYPSHKNEEKYIVPSTVRYITQGAFVEAKTLKSLTITPNVERLGKNSIPKKGLEELYFENVQLPYYQSSMKDVFIIWYPEYVPDVRNTVVYCVKGSELYDIYKKSFEEPEAICKELKELPAFTETLKKEEDGKWYYYCNDYKMYYSSTLIKHSGKWFYVSNGVWNKTVTDKIIKYKEKWFYIKNGKWNSNINTLVKKDGEWLGIVNGKWDSTAKTLVKYQGKWFYVNKGKWCKDTAIVKYKGKRFYVKNGKVDFDYSGKKKINGKTYKIKNGKVA